MNIQSLLSERQLRNFRAKIAPPDQMGCMIWQGGRNIYKSGSCGMYLEGHGCVAIAHRMTWMLTHNVLLTRKQQIVHTCGNLLCQNPEHLQEMTKAETTAYTSQNRRKGFITEAQREKIKSLRRSGLSYQKVAESLNISYKTVWYTVNGTLGQVPKGRKPGGQNREKN